MTGAAILVGLVIAIADGDTLTLLDDQHRQVKVRLAEIDAPEKKQPFGTRSRQSLGGMCHEKRAEVLVTDLDRYGRTVGRVTCAGRDANSEQVRRGLAWVYDRYATDKSLYRLQDEVRAAGRGLWGGQGAGGAVGVEEDEVSPAANRFACAYPINLRFACRAVGDRGGI